MVVNQINIDKHFRYTKDNKSSNTEQNFIDLWPIKKNYGLFGFWMLEFSNAQILFGFI